MGKKRILIGGEIVFRKKSPLLVISCTVNESGTDVQVCVTVCEVQFIKWFKKMF